MKKQYQQHGKTGTKLYKNWKRIKNRCFNINEPAYKHYGGRGITMQSDWINDFLKFEAYVISLDSYDKDNLGVGGLSLDREDNDGNYEEKNLKWSTATIQARNQRKKSTNTSGYRGVYYNKSEGKYVARISTNEGRIYLGLRPTAKEAYQLRINYIKKHNLKGFENQLNK